MRATLDDFTARAMTVFWELAQKSVIASPAGAWRSSVSPSYAEDGFRLGADDRRPSWLPRNGHFLRSILARKRTSQPEGGPSSFPFAWWVSEHQGKVARRRLLARPLRAAWWLPTLFSS